MFECSNVSIPCLALTYMFSASPTQRRVLLPGQPESNPEQGDACLERSGVVIPGRFVREHTWSFTAVVRFTCKPGTFILPLSVWLAPQYLVL